MLKHWFLFAMAGLSGLLYGIDIGVIAAALPYLKAATAFTDAQLSLIVGAVVMGAVVSALFAGALAERFGRRPVILLAAALNVAAEELTGEAPLSTPACGADALTRQIQSLYAGGTLREEDMDNMMLAIQEAYLIAKKKKTRDRMKGNQND